MSHLTVSLGQPWNLSHFMFSWCLYLFNLQMWQQQGSFLILVQKARLMQLPQTDPFSFTDYRIIPTTAGLLLMVERLNAFLQAK